MIEESAMAGRPARAPGAASTATLLCLLLLVIYNANFRLGPSGDTLPARFLPFSLVCDRTLYLDDWVKPYLRGAYEDGGHFLTAARGHWMSSYPIVTPALVSPLYIAPAWWLRSQPAAARQEAARLIARTMEKLSASLLAALSAAVLYLALLRITTPGAALLVTLVYALAANTWSISSQALWLHAVTQLSFAFLIWALLRCGAFAFFLATVVFSLWVQCVGAFCYTWQWDNRPASVDAHPERLWDWRDSQVLRSWREGRAYPDLYYDWVDYLNARR